MDALSQLLGMHNTRDIFARTISLDESKYLSDILGKHGMTECKPSPLPMDPGFVSGLASIDTPRLTGVAKDIFPNLLGSLKYEAVCTRPYVSTALRILGSAKAHPTEAHLQALKKLVRLMKGTIQLRSTMGGDRSHPPTKGLR
jgi:hypothetical protein